MVGVAESAGLNPEWCGAKDSGVKNILGVGITLPPTPFVLSLSKDRFCFAPLANEGRSFDELRTNGF